MGTRNKLNSVMIISFCMTIRHMLHSLKWSYTSLLTIPPLPQYVGLTQSSHLYSSFPFKSLSHRASCVLVFFDRTKDKTQRCVCVCVQFEGAFNNSHSMINFQEALMRRVEEVTDMVGDVTVSLWDSDGCCACFHQPRCKWFSLHHFRVWQVPALPWLWTLSWVVHMAIAL